MDITPTQIVNDLFEEAKSYEKYRLQFKPAYTQFLSNVGFEESDWKNRRAEHRCALLHQNLIQACLQKDQEIFLNDIRPTFEAAIRVELDYYQLKKKQLQVLYDFYNNQYEKQKTDLIALGPKLEELQKSKTTLTPDKRQELDAVLAKFTELQRSIKSKITPTIETTQAQHLKVIRDVLDLYQKENEQISTIFAAFVHLLDKKPKPVSNPTEGQLPKS